MGAGEFSVSAVQKELPEIGRQCPDVPTNTFPNKMSVLLSQLRAAGLKVLNRRLD